MAILTADFGMTFENQWDRDKGKLWGAGQKDGEQAHSLKHLHDLLQQRQVLMINTVLLTPIPGNSKSCRDHTSEEVITNTRSYL